jgi:lipopolysaccharide biosynthesis regulator YciM
MSDFSLLTWVLVVAALVIGILAGHFGWGKRWPGSSKLHPDYLAGLDFLVTEQPDRALDVFLKLMEANADTIETHFALGALYRRRGEVERAIRIHQNLLARSELASEHREQALLALARDYLRAGVLDRAERLFQQVSEVARLRSSALDALRGVYERQHDWQQALQAYRELARVKAAPPPNVAGHYLCELAAQALERDDIAQAREFLREVAREISPFPRAALLRAELAHREGDNGLAAQLLREALNEAPALLQDELPSLVKWVGEESQQGMLSDLAAEAAAGDFEDRKRLVFAAFAAGVASSPSLKDSVQEVFSKDPVLSAVWNAAPEQYPRVALEIGALLEHAEKYRCNECGFSTRSFYWQCPACHAWDSFDTYAIIKLR